MSADDPIIVVYGLPRSGTSLMMQMLRAGGIPLLTDERRPADISNPRGYFEYEKVKWLAADNSWLGEARGRALKVIAQLVPFLPGGLPYLVLFIERDLSEVVDSQQKMLSALSRSPVGTGTDLRPVFERHLKAAQDYIGTVPGGRQLTIHHRDILTVPDAVVNQVVTFLERPTLDRLAMKNAIDASLYRSRTSSQVDRPDCNH